MSFPIKNGEEIPPQVSGDKGNTQDAEAARLLEKARAIPKPPLGEDLSPAEGITVWRNVPDGHAAIADAHLGKVKPRGVVKDSSAIDRAYSHDHGDSEGSGFTSWSVDLPWLEKRQAALGGVILQRPLLVAYGSMMHSGEPNRKFSFQVK